MQASYQELANQRYDSLLRQHPDIALSWARSQAFNHVLLSQLAELGWSREDQLQALQELHRTVWVQVAQFEQQENH